MFVHDFKKGGKHFKFYKYHDVFHKSMLGKHVLLSSDGVIFAKDKYNVVHLGPSVMKKEDDGIFKAYFPVRVTR